MRLPKATLASGLAGVMGLIMAAPAWANFAPRFWGDVTTEPWGMEEVAIARERLTIDLRPLSESKAVRVEVTYELSNAGPLRNLDLLFASGEVGVSDFEAHLGDKRLNVKILGPKETRGIWERAPRSWKPPIELPGLESEWTYIIFNTWQMDPALVTLSVDLPPGRSTLRVRYRARACGTAERPTVTWQFPYVLAPAREWGSFGGLHVEVYLPDGWLARSTPALDREGDTLHGDFTELPADVILLAAGAPVPHAYYRVRWLSYVLFGITLVGGGVMCWWVGRRRGRARARTVGREASAGAQLLGRVPGIVPALLWGVCIYVLLPGSQVILKLTLRGQENPYFEDAGWDAACLIFFIIPAVVLLGFIITGVSSAWAESRSQGTTKGSATGSQGCG
jgi:hypothetical protein